MNVIYFKYKNLKKTMFVRRKYIFFAGILLFSTACSILLLVSMESASASRKLMFPTGQHSKQPLLYYFNNTAVTGLSLILLPEGVKEKNDRLFQQLELEVTQEVQSSRKKIILQYTDLSDRTGSSYFEERCLVKSCTISNNKSLMTDGSNHVDAVVFGPRYILHTLPPKKQSQIWALFMLESPLHTVSLKQYEDRINWTLTYRVDSTIVTPYFKYKNMKEKNSDFQVQEKNFAEGKSKLIAWFVSNCHDKNGRLSYVRELQKYLQVGSNHYIKCFCQLYCVFFA